jgi:hypothetical protein
MRVINPYLTWRKTVAPGSIALLKVPFAVIVNFCPLQRVSNIQAGYSTRARTVEVD